MLRVPTIRGVIDRRVLVNFRIDPGCLDGVLPDPLRPQVVRGYAIGGICLIRFRRIRPDGWPAVGGLRSENAAHRIAVEWDEDGQVRTGVFIPRRDTDSRLNTLAGGRLFPGEHRPAVFDCDDITDRLSVRMRSRDGAGSITVTGRVTDRWPTGSVFDGVAEASAFFERGALGFSPRPDSPGLDALELETINWTVAPLHVEHVESSFFGDGRRFPSASAVFDSALLMRDIDHRWHQRQPPCGGADQNGR